MEKKMEATVLRVSQNYGPLLVIGYIGAPNIWG